MKETVHHVHHHLPKSVNFLIIVVTVILIIVGLNMIIPEGVTLKEPTVTGAVVGTSAISGRIAELPPPPPSPPQMPPADLG